MKKLLAVMTLMVSFGSFAVDFTCYASKGESLILSVDSESAILDEVGFDRDRTYVPGKNGKKYNRYFNSEMDLLVPTLMAQNKTNRGNIVFYEAAQKIIFHCVK